MGLIKLVGDELKKIIKNYIEDILILLGLILMNIPFYFLVNKFIGIGVSGLILFILGIFFSIRPLKEVK